MDTKLVLPATTGASSLLLAVGHWFPWPRFICVKLPRLGAYVYGSLAIWLGFFAWRKVVYNDHTGPLGLLALYIVGGLTTTFAYLLDFYGQTQETERRKNKA